MRKRPQILVGMACGAVWGVVVLWWGVGLFAEGDNRFNVSDAMIIGLFPAGLLLIAMIGRLAQRRFFDDAIIDGEPLPPGSPAEIDQRVLTNTVEQIVLAVCIWPVAGGTLGPGVVIALGISFGVARLLFWIGYHISPPLRGLGFAATFYPTVLAALWAIITIAS